MEPSLFFAGISASFSPEEPSESLKSQILHLIGGLCSFFKSIICNKQTRGIHRLLPSVKHLYGP